jgi:hypothetical protein
MDTAYDRHEVKMTGTRSARVVALGVLALVGCATSAVQTPPAPTSPAPATAAPTISPSDHATTVLIATQDGIFSVSSDGVVEEVALGATVIAVDDTRGGLLFQEVRGRWDGLESPGGATAIRWIQQGSGETVDLVVPEQGQFLQLHDAVGLGGDLAVYFTRSTGSTPDDMEDLLVRLDPVTGMEAEVRTVGGWEWGSDPISVTPSLIGATSTSSVTRSFDFFDHDGTDVDVSGNPLDPPASDCASCPDLVELSPDASILAYVEFGSDHNGYETIPELVLVDPESGNELERVRLDRPDQGWVPASIDLGDSIVVVNRFVSGEGGSDFDRPLVIDLREDDPVIWEVPMVGNARLLRTPLEIGS